MKILMVCLGNICRSPMAAGIMAHHARQAGLPWEVQSAGTGDWHMGQPAHHLSRLVAQQFGINIDHHRARRMVPADLQYFDHLFFMDSQNLADGRQIAGSLWIPAKTSLMLDEIAPQGSKNVPDPYNGNESDFLQVFHLLNQACQAYLSKNVPQ